MKKFISIALCVIFTVLLAGCNFGEKTSSKPTDKPVYFYDPPEIVENPTIGSRSESLDFIFNNQTLGETTIVIKRSEWNKLCDDYRYLYKNENFVCADSYTYEKDGQKWVIKNVGFRLRGNTSRYCPQGLDNGREQGQMNADWNADYYNTEGVENNRYRQVHFKVDFEEFAADGVDVKMADCMKCVALKRMDASCTREIFCYDLFHRYGIWTAPRASHTKVIIKIIEDIKNPSAAEATTTVNYGVYEMFEEVNKQSLKARDKDENTSKNAWQNSKGNLWKCSNDLTIGHSREMGVEDIRIIHSYEGRPTGFQTNGRENGDRVGYVWKQYSLDLKTNKDNFSAASAELRGFIQELNALPNTDDESDIDSILTSTFGINLQPPKNYNTILSHFYSPEENLLTIKKIMKSGRAIRENNLLMKISCCIYTLITNSYILTCFIREMDIIQGQLNFIEIAFLILSIAAFTARSDNDESMNNIIINKKLYICHYVSQISGLILIKIIAIYFHGHVYHSNDYLTRKEQDRIYVTFYFLFCLEQLFSTVMVLNLISFYRKSWFFNTFFIIFCLIIFLYFTIIVTLTSSNYNIDIFNFLYFEYLENIVDAYDEYNKTKIFIVCFIDFIVSVIYSTLIYLIFYQLTQKNHNSNKT